MVGYTARAKFFNRRVHDLPLGLGPDFLERLLGEPIEAEDEALERGIQDLLDVVVPVEQGSVGIQHQVAAADFVGVVQPVPQLVAQDEGLAVEGRPNLTIRRFPSDFLDNLVVDVARHVLLWPHHLAMRAVDALQVAIGGGFYHQLPRINRLRESAFYLEQLGDSILVLGVFLPCSKVESHQVCPLSYDHPG